MDNRDAYIDALRIPMGVYIVFFSINFFVEYFAFKGLSSGDINLFMMLIASMVSMFGFVLTILVAGYAGWRIVYNGGLGTKQASVAGFFLLLFKILLSPINFIVSYLKFGGSTEELIGSGSEESIFASLFIVLMSVLFSYIFMGIIDVGSATVGGYIGKAVKAQKDTGRKSMGNGYR